MIRQASAAMAAPCPLLGDGITDDTLLHIATFLPTAKDFVRLQLTNPRFAAKAVAAPAVGPPSDEMYSGGRVEIFGVVSPRAQMFNGVHGTVMSFDEDRCAYLVNLDGETTRRAIVKRANLRGPQRISYQMAAFSNPFFTPKNRRKLSYFG